ncbi:GNAT family N-acetyltransferase [Paenibacillus sanguinis]|uniref:GNAT family N-acetyltransferase n=1 Tax=Paenibacillus sanguinis TaxID=225906 RepID=UPI000376408C|nr:GNAT family N-acetyltransferase [Paenibacillus sanguinis]
MVKLNRMNASEYSLFLERSIRDYAEDKVTAGTWKEKDALRLARESMEQYLPNQQHTEGAHLFTVRAADSDTPIGHLWFSAVEKEGIRSAFIYDILIDDPFQGQGYGQATMKALEHEVRALGLNRISLHVFGHNERAFRLYQKMGYLSTDITMIKYLDEI